MTTPDSFFAAKPDDSGIKRDQWGRPLLPHPDTGVERYWTRVSTFAKTLSDTFALGQWETRMVAKGLTLRPDLYALAASTPLEDYKTLNRITSDAKEAAGSKVKANKGSALHQFAEQVDAGQLAVADIPEPWRQDIEAYLSALKLHKVEIKPTLIERLVVTPEVECAGSFDRLVYHKGKYKIADMKTGEIKYSMMEIAVQLAVYANATGMWDPLSKQMWPAFGEVSKSEGLVFHLPAGQAECTVYEVDLDLGWRVAKMSHEVRELRKLKTYFSTSHVAASDEDLTDMRPAVVTKPRRKTATKVVAEPTWADKISEATTRDDLRIIWAAANARGEWTDDLKALGDNKIKELESK